ncbi:helicase domino isoform X1 [Bactrocera neohumeralis]|uniref:helicase domino isoform X1 n=1 Tax=Bactrocera neohumeralis TaxID=98809 RepID=UPI002166BC5E|nr:helicase domino isoform X1 [Bactrocera neohumeralis]XP_050324375.1 helicase domino isoform X1 [Bactrocera neohumeralis]
MNEGESAGGGHQRASPAPPAVSDHRSVLSSTNTTASVATTTYTGIITPTTITVATPEAHQVVATTFVDTSVTPRSFQQAFTQQHLPKLQQQINTTTTRITSTNLQSSQNKSLQQKFQQQVAQAQQTSMPQKSLIAVTANTASDFVSLAQNPIESITGAQNTQRVITTETSGSLINSFISTTSTSSVIGEAAQQDTYSGSPLAKRPKLVGNSIGGGSLTASLLPASGSTPDNSNTAVSAPQDINALKKRIVEQKYFRLRSLKERHTENVAELFYLQSGGNMMDYPTWRKKPPTPQFVTFSNAYRLDQLVNEDKAAALAQQQQQQQQQKSTDNIATIIGVASGNQQQQQQQQLQTQKQTQDYLTAITNKTSTQSQIATEINSSNSNSSGGSNSNSSGSGSAPTTAAATSNASNLLNATVAAAAAATTTTTATATTSTPGSASVSGNSTTTNASGDVLPQGAEIKIPAVGATPVAVSTKLPAAVVQLTQQGGTPLVPAIGSSVGGGSPAVLRRNGNGANAAASPGGTAGVGSSNLQTNTPATPNAVLVPATVNGGGAVAAAASGSSSGVALSGTTSSLNTPTASNSVQEFSFKAKQEVYVLQRVSELQREGLWTEKRLPKLQEPSRPKAHWDYLLEEMVWLAADFAQERKWKKNAAKKCAKMVQKYFQDKANAAQKAEKAQEAHLKRIAAFLSKEVKMFWSNVEKLVEYKHHTKLEEKRKKALDQHLSFIVDQTEKFSQQLAEGMNKSIMDATAGASGAPSMDSSRISSPKREATAGNGSDDDFRPESGSEDDEETIAKAEEEAADVKEEVAALEKESQMDLDDFLKDLPKGYLENRDKIMLEEEEEDSKMATSSQEDDADDAEFEANEESDDDENTISKQEEDEMDIDHQKEIDDLEADNDLTVEQLLAKYKSGKIDEPTTATTARNKKCTPPAKKRAKVEIDSDDDEVADDASSDGTVVETESESGGEDTNDEEAPTSNDESEENEQEDGLKSLLEDTEGNSKDDMIKDAAALAESIQPKGNTLSSTNVVTPVPFLLKHSLREYQHIGLDWLVTMNERKLNGILADEMGLGKTIQTIALLAHLACVKGNWGPHLIVVPSSVMLNWEMEFKKWCPAFKILTYYGTQKERKMKRVGWTKPNAFHVCITSYKLVVQDQQSFRRKKWKYLILDEAQNIKNFKSQRWQLLLNFSTERRLLLTGTPLQNDLMELWSLMHFLMPYVFSSHREFKEWFSNPMTGMIEGNMEYNETLISRLHKVIRPFLLRRLKKEVEKQMPKKYEHVVMCRLSNRQRYLYDDFMSRAKTKETLQTGSLLSVINVLMQLRKVCNHPNMFEVRPTISPFQMEGITYEAPRIAYDLLEYDPFTHVDLHALNLLLIDLELTLTAYVSHKSRVLEAPRKLIEEIDNAPAPPPSCPRGKFKFYIRVRDQQVQQNLSQHSTATVRVGASPAMRTEGNKLVPLRETNTANIRLVKRLNNINPVNTSKMPALSMAPSTSSTTAAMAVTNSTASGGGSAGVSGIGSIRTAPGISVTRVQVTPQAGGNLAPPAAKIAKLVQHGSGKEYFIVTSSAGSSALSDTISGSGNAAGNRLTLVCKSGSGQTNIQAVSGARANVGIKPKAEKLLSTIAQQVKNATNDATTMDVDEQETTATETSEGDPIYNMQEILEKRKEQRVARLKLLSTVNRRRIEGVPIYGEDCRDALVKCVRPNQTLEYTTWQTRSHTNCSTAMTRRDSWTLSKILKSYEKRVEDLRQTFGNFVIYVPSACAPRIRFFVQHLTSGRLQRERAIEQRVTQYVSPKLALLHPVISAMTTQFPDPRLIQYDCGKLQTLDRLLRQLKSEQHRVLIFTQMTKMLDVLEAFLNYHGHIYLRLDGSTRVEQRQVLMERFNGDKRIFCFILSTRSGGVGINLTGADTVIFYDSDWNPTMDAQAQDRCHRIGQTRDVHIYRLVSEKTIEVNILKKANQKRMLSDMAIEGGNFTTTYFKSSTIKDLFNLEQADQDGSNSSASDAASANGARADKAASSTSTAAAIVSELGSEIETEKQSLRAFESALAAAEDEQDVQATKTAKAEAAADLAEFDETIPIDEATMGEGAATTEMSRADLEMQNLVKQLSPIERYAMRFVEETGAAWTAEQLRAAEEEIEAQKREWEANRLAALQKEEEMLKKEAEADEMLTYNRKDASNQIWISDNTMEQMPMWCPPTPPQDDNDIYIDYSLTFMYEMNPIPEVELPPVYIKKDYKRSRCDAGFAMDGSRRPLKMRREDNYVAPRSLFDRPSAAIARIRRDLKNQRYRGVFKPNVQIPGLKPQTPQKQLVEPEGMAEWTIFEDIVILHVLVNLQGLPCNLMVLSPGHTPNWDLVSEIVNFQAKTFRSAKQCRWRYEMVIQPREEGKFVESPKKQKKMKAMLKSEYLKGPLRYLRTTQLYANDNNTSFTKLMRSRFDCIKAAYLKKAPPPKRHFSTPNLMNPKHMEVLQEFGISNYDQPISPLNIAAMKANKIREKQRSQCPPPPPPVPAQAVPVQQQQQQVQQQQQTTAVQIQEMVVQQQQNVSAGGASTLQQAGGLHTQQLQIQHIPSGNVQGVTQQPTATAIVLQHAGALPVTHQQQAAGNAAAQSQQQQQQQILRAGMGNTQIVKAIVAPQTGLLTAGQMQQLTQQAAAAGAQHVQLQQQGGNVGSSSTVSVVLTTPVQTLSSSVQSAQQHVQSSNAQIVSISPQTIVSSGASQSGGSIVQTIPSQTLPQVVSVSQLATVGTVLTTSANLQPSGTVTTLNTSALRAQRIVAATTGALQDVVLQQRSGNPSPTIVSMSNLGPNVAAAQFQAAQLRLTSMPGTTQQVTKVPVSTLQQSAKLTSNVGGNAPPHIQLYRQRQQLKVLQTTSGQGGGQTLVQTASGQTALVNAAGTIIQGSLVQTAGGQATMQVQGQKVAVATVSSSNMVAAPSGGVAASVATVQVAHQGRTQFIKQVAGKQTIARQVGDDMVLVKRQVIGAHQKAQVLQQGQIFNTTATTAQGTTVQLQQQQTQGGGGSAQQQLQAQQQQQQQVQQVTAQQIATLVKTSSGAGIVQQGGGGVTVSTGGGQQQGTTVNMALSHLKPGGQIKVTTSMANQAQMRQLHMQPLNMPRKINRMTQIATGAQGGQQVTTSVGQSSSGATVVQQPKGAGGVQTQLVHIQNTKSLPSSVTVQQIQHVMRQGQQGSLAATGLVLSKTSVGRVIPVSVASQSNQRQTIQVRRNVVSAASAQAALAAGNLRAHVTSGQNIAGTIKVGTAGGNQSQTQQTIHLIQQQVAAQQGQRQNASPVRLQTAGGNLVAVVQQQSIQQQQQQGMSTSSIANSSGAGQGEVMTITQTIATSSGGGGGAGGGQQQQQQQQTVQQSTAQQVRTLVKKKIMQIRSEKE